MELQRTERTEWTGRLGGDSGNRGAARRGPRRGATLVEFAVVAPILFLMVFALMEFGRMTMCYQVITNSVREGARLGTVPGTTSADVTARVNAGLAAGFINGATVSVQPAEVASLDQGDTFTVTAQVNYNSVGWLPVPQWLGGRMLSATCTMTREGS